MSVWPEQDASKIEGYKLSFVSLSYECEFYVGWQGIFDCINY